MFKQFLLLLLTIVVAVKPQINNSSAYTDDYINLHRRIYAKNIKDYDLQLETFQKSYDGRLDNINITTNMLNKALIQNDRNLNPLEILNDSIGQCIKKYRPLMPTISYVKTTSNSCILIASNQKMSLLASPRVTRNNLEYYYSYSFENDITNCQKTFVNSSLNHTLCVTSVISTTNIYTINNQNVFAVQIDAAQCSANDHIEKALHCSISAQHRTIYLTAEGNTLIERCLQGLDDCERNINLKTGSSLPNPFY